MKNQKAVYLNKAVFLALFQQIIERHCVEISKTEIMDTVKNLAFKSFFKKHHEGIEKCFHGFFNGCEVIVCTTWSDYLDAPKEHDIAWVLLISPNSKEPFFSFEIRRTKNFSEKVLAWLDCMIEIAQRWPTLPGTDIKLQLVRSSVMHMRRFKPPKSNNYPIRKPYYFWIVEMDLSEKNSKFLINAFKKYYTYRKKDGERRSGEGKEPRQVRRVMRHDSKKGIHRDDSVFGDGPHLE